MADIRAGEGFAGVTIAGLVNGLLVAGEGGVHQVEASLRRKGGVVARQAGRQDTIEDVHAAQDTVDQIFGCADSHQVARLVFRQQRGDHIQHGVHFLFGLAHGESADGDARGVERGDELGGFRPQGRIHPTLHNPEQGLIPTRLRFERALRPAMRPLHGDFAVLVIVRVGALVKRHDDIRAEVFLNGDGLFGREAMRRAVNVAFEGHAVVINFAGLCEGKNLKAARIREHGLVPLHKLVQAAHVAHQFVAGTQVKVIGVAQHQRGVDLLEMFGGECFYGGLRADGRKDRCDEVAVRRGENPRAGAVVFGCDLELEHGSDYNGG